MKSHPLPVHHEPTRVRRMLQVAELVRYRLEYRQRLAALRLTVASEGTSRLTRAERQSVRAHWRQYGIRFLSLEWYRLFKALLGHVDPRFIPEETFRTRIEPMLCRQSVSAAYHDKNQLDRQFPELLRPATVLRNIYGHYYDADYRPLARSQALPRLQARPGALFLKPAISGTGSGHNVARVTAEPDGVRFGDRVLSLAELENIYVQDFLVQEGVVQHETLARFYTGSLNTIRLITLRLADQIIPLAGTFRMGNGSHVDNGHAGGLLCGVRLTDGQLTDFACDVAFRRHQEHPLSRVPFAGQHIPSIHRIVAMASAVHQRLPYFDQISCDIAVLPDGNPCLIEVNTFGQGIEPHQFLKGAPLFGEHTVAVLELVARRERSGWNA